jgi:uncharacterized protein YjbI with pentapeptide repeats
LPGEVERTSESPRRGRIVSRRGYRRGMADFLDADLRNSRLERVDLSGAQLRAVDLTGAQFRDVELSGIVMRGVELTGADIYEAHSG